MNEWISSHWQMIAAGLIVWTLEHIRRELVVIRLALTKKEEEPLLRMKHGITDDSHG